MPTRPDDHREVPLDGGNQAEGVVRIADTVRRPAQSWSPAIRVLLVHLETAAPGISPRSLGTDDQGRDVFSFEAGTVGHYPLDDAMRGEAALLAAAGCCDATTMQPSSWSIAATCRGNIGTRIPPVAS